MLHRFGEIGAVRVGLETDEIEIEHGADQLAMPWQPQERRVVRKRRVQEQADRTVDAELAQFVAERQEMVVVDPDRSLRRQKSPQRPRHDPVDVAVGQIIVVVGVDEIRPRVQYRP